MASEVETKVWAILDEHHSIVTDDLGKQCTQALLKLIEAEVTDALAKSDKAKQPSVSKSLTEVLASLELPWPKDVFGEVPKDDWSDIDDWLRENKGYAIDTVSGTLMRRGWANYERLLREQVNDLVEQGFVISTDVANPQSKLKEEL